MTSPTPPTSTTPTAGAPSAPTQRALLQDAYRDRLALMNRHVEGATRMADYEFNNTYQYVIGREEIHVQWLRDALIDLGATVPADAPALAVPEGKGVAGERAILEDDLRAGRAFADKWRARLGDVRNARHRRLLADDHVEQPARSASRPASSSWRWPAVTICWAPACRGRAPATASCPSAG